MLFTGEVRLNQLLPAGNFAVGMAWSHFAGYLKNILPGTFFIYSFPILNQNLKTMKKITKIIHIFYKNNVPEKLVKNENHYHNIFFFNSL